MSHIARNGTSAYIGLPEREASKLQDLWQRDEVGMELSVEVHAPVVVGIYPMRIARFVLDQASGLNGHANGNGVHPTRPARPRRSGADRRRGRMKVAAVLTDLMALQPDRVAMTSSLAGTVRSGWRRETTATVPCRRKGSFVRPWRVRVAGATRRPGSCDRAEPAGPGPDRSLAAEVGPVSDEERRDHRPVTQLP